MPREIVLATWEMFLLASPYILLGLTAAGVLNVLVRSDRIALWLGRPGFGSVVRAALVGVPLPLCSCAVVPVTIELSRKGASREASLAFLVSTPETGVDSILLTWGLMGPVMAIARPLAALATSLAAAGASMVGSRRAGSNLRPSPAGPPSAISPVAAEGVAAPASGPGPIRRILRYAFVSMVDEIGFWLVIGLLLTGVISALVPEDIVRAHLGEGPVALLALLVLGIPLYMCASASTPIAAALLLKGISPGAALVFLLSGPATNASTVVLIARFFGRRFVRVYLTGVVAVALASGLLFDLLLRKLGWTIQVAGDGGSVEETGLLSLVAAFFLFGLLAWSMLRGSWRSAVREFTADIKQWRQFLRSRES